MASPAHFSFMSLSSSSSSPPPHRVGSPAVAPLKQEPSSPPPLKQEPSPSPPVPSAAAATTAPKDGAPTARYLASPYLEAIQCEWSANADPVMVPTGQATTSRPYEITSLTRAVEGLAIDDPVAAMLSCAVTNDPIVREAWTRARVSVVDQRHGNTITVSAAYYAYVATVLGVKGLVPVVHAMVRAVLYAYMAWSTDDESLMRVWVPDPNLCDAIASCARRMPDGGGPKRTSPVLAAAGITMETASTRDLTSWLVMPTERLRASDVPAALFGGRLLAATGPGLAREPHAVRLADLSAGSFAAPPDLARQADRVIHRVRSISPCDLLRLAGWTDSEPPPHARDVVSVLPADDRAFWKRMRAFVDASIVAYMPGAEGEAAGCASLARDGHVPRLSQLFAGDLCVVSVHGVPCIFMAPRRLDSALWTRAFEAVGLNSPFASAAPPS
ncbi:hypothetical protein psal_cds_267 [Pandoravirus salinus]|uniref:Uncharacterized protein n=1 Tax=Pandoravirus salinus TaxID=1349410 RepID=A0A291ATP1_9VIRU|nr:hypothetical protein psal_cds_267 [Pandoravirus salinus]ATE82148.1 hypothetical protein psal_cds_267 [Pandoravirus salinus]